MTRAFTLARASMVALAAASLTLAATASAQTSPESGTDTANSDKSQGLSEIVVTAQRQQQGTLSVPLSIAAIGGDQLNKMGVQDLTSIQFTVPGFVPSEKAGTTLLYVRGIGNGVLSGADPSVATYIDDVPRIYATLVNSLVDVERIEVLKGAQGGLYGRNATGGVLNIITRSPSTDAFFGGGLLSYGERNAFRAQGYVNLPIGSKAALIVSLDRESRGPDVKNVAPSSPYSAANFPTGSYLGTPQQTADYFNAPAKVLKGYGDEDLWAASAKLLIKPTDNLRITLAGDYNHRSDTDGTQALQQAPEYVVGQLRGLFSQFGIQASIPDNFLSAPTGKFELARSLVPKTVLKDYGTSLTAVLSLPTVDVTSISAYRNQYSAYYDDIVFAAVPIITSFSPKKQHFYYQELRAVSTGSGPFHFLAGATYLKNVVDQNSVQTILPPLFSTVPTIVHIDVRNWSVYGQAGYDITDRLNVTASARYIHEVNDTSFSSPTVSAARLIAKKLLPSATISYKLTDGGNVYARYAKGFKAGGINPIVAPSVFNGAKGSSFLPESVDTFEVGYRAALFDRSVQLTTAVFYNNYKNLQTGAGAQPEFPQIIYALVNAGSARTWGAEASVVWKATPAITLGINGGYLDAKYKTFSIVNDPVLQPFDRSGQRMINSPSLQFGANADLDQPLSDRIRLVGNLTTAYTSKINFNYSGAEGFLPDGIQNGYWLVNTRIGLATSDAKYRLSLFATNLFNKGYFTYIGSAASVGSPAQWGRPRTIGVEFGTKL